jgi:hypothetical protein
MKMRPGLNSHRNFKFREEDLPDFTLPLGGSYRARSHSAQLTVKRSLMLHEIIFQQMFVIAAAHHPFSCNKLNGPDFILI